MSNKLDSLHILLEEANRLLKRYATSTTVTEDGFSFNAIEVLLQACKLELTKIEVSTAGFWRTPEEFQDLRRRVR